MKLIVKEKYWSGWTNRMKELVTETDTKEVKKVYKLKKGKKYIARKIKFRTPEEGQKEYEILSFDVKEINEDSVVIRTHQELLGDDYDTERLLGDKQKFTITTEKPLVLETPTKDAGYIFTLSLEKE